MYAIADPHFLHVKAIMHNNRPYKDGDEQTERLIENWNNKIASPNSYVYVIGDFAFCRGQYDKMEIILSRLKGRIKLIPGDHDKHNIIRFLKRNPKWARKVEVLMPIEKIKFHYQQIILCHYQMRVWPRSHYNSWLLHGHSHGMLNPVGKMHDAGVDYNNFTPLSIIEIFQIMEQKPDNFNLAKGYIEDKNHCDICEHCGKELFWRDSQVEGKSKINCIRCKKVIRHF